MMYISTAKERCVLLGSYLVENNLTVRAVAQKFGISKSTVHKDVAYRLRSVNPSLYSSVRAVLEKNKSERHIRGGMATREKYRKKSNFCSALGNISDTSPFIIELQDKRGGRFNG